MFLLAIEWYHYILATLFVSVCVLLMLVILLQRGRGSGLSGAFGGAGGSSHLGAKTGDILTLVTLGLAIVYAGLAICMNWWFLPITATDAPAAASLGATPGATPGKTTGTPQTPQPGGPPAPPLIDELSSFQNGSSTETASAATVELLFGDPALWPQPADTAG